MAKIYTKNAYNVYTIPIYKRIETFIALFIILACICSLVAYISDLRVLKIGQFFMWSVVVALLIERAYSLMKSVIKAKSISKYLMQKQAEKAVTKALLNTLTVNRLKDSPYIEVPSVMVCDNRPSHIFLEIEKLVGMYDIDKLIQDVNASFKNKLSNYAVTSASITSDGLKFIFSLEDVATDKTWRPSAFKDIQAKPYHLKLQKGLEIKLDERPHIAVWGKTGSKKTTVLLGMILQLFTMNADVRFLDGKDEFSAFKDFYSDNKIVSDANAVLLLLDDVLKIIKERQLILSNESRKRQKMGLKASELNLKPIVLIADEVGSIVALLDSKQTKEFIQKLTAIIQKGRSVGVCVITSTQDPSVDTLPQKIRQQFSTKILLGSANSETQRMAFGEVATVGNVEDFQGFYIADGLTTQPMKFFVCDLYSYNFNDLKAFKKAYYIGFFNLYHVIM